MASLTRDGVSVAYTFPAALPKPNADGPRLTYPEVYPGVDLVLTATSSTFSQVLVVKNRQAAKDPRVRSWKVKTDVSGGSLAGSKGGYVVKNSQGKEVLAGAAPIAWDATVPDPAPGRSDRPGAGNAPAPEAGRKAGHPAPAMGNTQKPMGLKVEGGALALSAPVELLDDESTTFPVSLDPTVYLANTCWFMVDSAYPNQEYANYTGSVGSAWGTHEAAGFNNYSGTHVKRLFFEFSNDRLVGKNITYATFNAFQAFAVTCDQNEGNNAYVLNTEISRPLTWNSQPANMTQSYGTFKGKTNPTYCNNGKVQGTWDITAAVKGRQGGNAATTTVVLKGSNGGSNSSWQRWLDPTTGHLNAPILAFDYNYDNIPALADLNVASPGVGMQSWYPVEEFAIRENLSLAVNVANGNVIVRDTDLKSNAPGVGLRLDRWYNSLSKATGTFGQAWKSGVGSDVRLVEDVPAATVYFVGPSGFISKWVNGKPDPGLNGTLTKNSDGTYRVKAQSSHLTMDFGKTGMLANIWDANGVGQAFGYNADGTTNVIVDAAGRKVQYTYAGGRAAKITQTGTDGQSRSTGYTYDGNGRLATSTDADGNTTRYAYEASGRLASITTARGAKLSIGYDSSGRAISIARDRDGGGQDTWRFTYNSQTQTTEVDPNGGHWFHPLDAVKKRTSVRDPYGNTQSQSFTANNNIATTTDAMGAGGGAGGNIVQFSWDTNNNPTQVKMPTGATSTLAYGSQAGCGSDGSGAGDKVTCATDAAGNKTGMTWDPAGNLTSSTAGAGKAGAATTTYTYQGVKGATGSDTACGGMKGQLCTATQPVVAGQSTGWKVTNTYDAYGNLTKSAGSNAALLGNRTFTYDGYGRVKSATDGKGSTLTYRYDNRDHITSVTGAKTTDDTWDADGNQTGNDGASISYDKQNRQTSLSVAGKSTRATYDAKGNLATYTDDTGATTTYQYFWHGRVASIALNGATCNWGRENSTAPGTALTDKAQAGCVKFAYDNNGLETGRVYPGGVIQSRAYDASSRVVAISSQTNNTGGLLTSQGYTYSKAGTDQTNVQTWSTRAPSLTPGPANGASQTFTYDSQNRVTGVVETGGSPASWGYAYDPMGNRTSGTRSGNTGATGNETATYNQASLLVSNTHGAFSYDKNGNEINAPGGPAGSAIPARTGQQTDAVGNVTSMTVAGASLSYGYSGTNPGLYNQLLSGPKATYARSILGLALSSQNVGGKTIRYITHPSGANIGYVAPEGQAWFLTDRLGTIIGLANDGGALIGSYSYDPYGVPRATAETGTVAGYNIHRYAGGLYDKTTGLTRFGVRWYNPATGRFATPDPSGKEKNNYLYAGGNCCNQIDPTGESFWDDLGHITLTVMGGVAGAAIGAGYGLLFGGAPGGLIGAAIGAGCVGNLVGSALDGSDRPGFDCVKGAAAGAIPGMAGRKFVGQLAKTL
ncbi:RHS repeat domain-containing protein [Austwickia chelonae]|uniref:RHS repeat domain-containing protein n=1 Tax=Austwickia chelonae TaxID=100225 RepID=UPI000E261093|nr:RHS repeat-associated core domain-containing protein [Austwickia chelonae]